MTIDQLAHRSGTAASTIRLYQTKGLLPPPAKQGRVGYYGDGHLARLRTVAQLQREGFSLVSINRLVDAWQHGRGLDEVLGLETQIAATFGAEEPLYLPPEELGARFPEGELSFELLQRTTALGLVSFDGDRIVVHSPRFLEIGSELAGLGIPVEEIIDHYELLQETSAVVADRFMELFERHLWASFVADGLPTAQVNQLTKVLQRLSSLAEGVVAVTMRQSFKRVATSFLASQVEPLQVAGVIDRLRPDAADAGVDSESPG